MQKKIQKKFFVFETLASELVALNVSIKKTILVIATQCLRKQS